MNRLILAAALAAGCTLASSAPALAAPRNYDCSKPGNANKAVCKGAAKAAPAAAKPAAKAKAAATSAAAPKSAARKTSAAAKPAAATAAVKPGIFQRMSNALRGSSTPAPAARRAAAPRKVAAAAPASVEDRNPAGAIAQCKDGSYSHAKARTGACSRHGGVAKWG
jgi:large subunit ribosomal protein L22e/Meckel syndrome type 1 protein